MTITNIRLLDGIGQALQSLGTAATDPMSKSLVHAASVAIDELRKRDDDAAMGARYQRGQQLVSALLAASGDSGELRNAFAALPQQLDADMSWYAATRAMEALLDVAERLSAAQRAASIQSPAALSALHDLFAWEADSYKPVPPVAAIAASAQLSADAVEQFIRSQGGDYAEARVTSFTPLSGGFSKQTILLDVETAKHGTEGFALRGDGAVKVLGLRGQEISCEFHLLKYAHAGGVLCAEPMWLNDQKPRPYFISRRQPGRNIGDGILGNDDIPDSVAKSLAEVMASIHLLPIDQAHPDIASSHIAAKEPLTREQAQRRFIEEWLAVWRKNGRKSPIAASAIQWVLDNTPADPQPAALVHCDCGFNNLLVHDGKVSALLDWEISHLGDPAEDISWLMYQIKNKDTQQLFLQHYRAAGGGDFDAFRLKYYDIIASLKMIIAMNDIGDRFQAIPDASVHLCAYALPYLQGPLAAINKQIEEAEQLRTAK